MTPLALLRLYIVTIAVAVSYLTLGVFDPEAAASLWWEYGSVSLVLAVLNLMAERWRRTHG